MDIRQLRYYCTIYEERQITKAAKVLHMAQPPLSHQLRLLEEELGVPLIIREAKKWEVTEAGHRLYERAKQVLHLLEETQKEISEIHTGISGTLTIGTSSICISYLTDHLNAFHAKFPSVYIKIFHGDTTYLEELLQQNQIDLALLLLPVEESNYSLFPLKEDPFVVVIPRQWEQLFPYEFISLEEISRHDLLLTKRTYGEGIYETIIHQFQDFGLTPKVVLDCPDISTILTLVATGMGMTIIPRSEIHQVYASQFKVLHFEKPFLSTKPALIWLKESYHSKAAQHLIGLFAEGKE